MGKIVLAQLFLLRCLLSYGQTDNNLAPGNAALIKELQLLASDNGIDADSALRTLSSWNKYPLLHGVNRYYLFSYKDPTIGTTPLKVFVPGNYTSDHASPAILILHGAVGISSFTDAYKDTTADEEFFYKYYGEHNFIVIRPFADPAKKFDWVVNHFNGVGVRNGTNRTFAILIAIITQLKQVLNIDDNRVFALGHSDGSDGSFGLEIYKPSSFAGFVAYNSMLTLLNSHDIYLRNTLNRPLYLVHSDLDDLRPIQQARLIVQILNSLKSPVSYREYIGYRHYDKHLELDLPNSYGWIKGTVRNPFQNTITWELSDAEFNSCDWLRIVSFDTAMTAASWQTGLNVKSYNKRDKTYFDFPYYDLNTSAAVKAQYNQNSFDIYTSRVREIEVLISPFMVDLRKPVVVRANGIEVFKGIVHPDKKFLLNNFISSFDRKAIWVNSIRLKINE